MIFLISVLSVLAWVLAVSACTSFGWKIPVWNKFLALIATKMMERGYSQ